MCVCPVLTATAETIYHLSAIITFVFRLKRGFLYAVSEAHMNNASQGGYPCSGCAVACTTFTTGSGTLSIGTYAANSDCNWIIAPAQAAQITITFNSMKTEIGYDFVEIFSCVSSACARDTIVPIVRLSGTQTGSYRSTTPYMLVKFTSDYSVEEEGFSATWTSQATVCMLFLSCSYYPYSFL